MAGHTIVCIGYGVNLTKKPKIEKFKRNHDESHEHILVTSDNFLNLLKLYLHCKNKGVVKHLLGCYTSHFNRALLRVFSYTLNSIQVHPNRVHCNTSLEFHNAY